MTAAAGLLPLRYSCRVIPFPATHQTVLERVRSADRDVRRAAFGDLAAGYWRPSYHYLRLRWHLPPEAAEDAVQAFFTAAFEKQYVERYDPARARFRTFLRVCLDRFVQNQRKAEAAQKRGGGAALLSLDFPDAERELAAHPALRVDDAERFFHDAMVRALFARAVEAMRAELACEGRQSVFDVFERHDLRPGPDTSYATVAAACGLTLAQVTSQLHAARRRFRDTALAQLRAMAADDDEYRAEARQLFGVEVQA
jgi:DNA-directed RNA polymerase specialized sigma24 family protein